MSLKKIFIINLLFGAFACLAHFPVVIFRLIGASGFESVKLWQVLPLIPIDLTLLIGSIVALSGSEKLKLKMLPIHAVIMCLVSLFVIGMLLRVVFIGFPDSNFSWSAGLGAATVGYTIHLTKRAFYHGNHSLMKNAGWYSAGIVLAFELLLIFKFYETSSF